MPKNLFFANWPVNTLETTASHSLQQKLTNLAQAVDDAEQFLIATANRLGVKDPLFVFTAPEYYFVKDVRVDRTGVHMELYDKTEKDTIYSGLKQISAAHKKMVLLPGTVHWKTPRKIPTGRNNVRVFDGINVAPVLYKGSVEFEYEKKFDDGSCREQTPDVAFRAGNGEQTFKLQGVRFGIEVCGDFEESRLAAATDKPLDVEIYMSATNPHAFTDDYMARIPVRNGGYLIHCDASGEASKNGVWLINRGGGWHGMTVDISRQDAKLYDPFTCKAIDIGHKLKGDYEVYGITGETLAMSKVFKVTLDPSYQRVALPVLLAPPKPLPAPMGGSYGMRITAIEPLGMTDLGFRAKVTVQIKGNDGTTQRVSAAAIQFSCPRGLVTPLHGVTDAKGLTSCTIAATGNGPLTVTASWQGAKSSATIELLNLGMGNVSKMGKLQGNPNDALPSWHVLL